MPSFAETVGAALNRFRPILVLVAFAAALAAASGAGARANATPHDLPALDRAVFAQINRFRTAHGLHTLRLSRQLDAAASQHSNEMVVDGYFSHNSADGTPPTRRIRRYYPSGNHRYWSAGENLLYGSPTISASSALSAWAASPPHLRNLLDPRWREIGVSAVHSASAPGFYRHQAVTVITTDFGVRR